MKVAPYNPSAPDASGNPMFRPATGLEGADGLVGNVALAFVSVAFLLWLFQLFVLKKREERHRALTALLGALEGAVGSWRAIFLYGAFALWALFPVVLSPASRVAGSPYSDVWKHLWGHWWVRESLLAGGGFPLHTDLVGSPAGGSLYCIDPLDALVSVPLQSLFGLVASFNVQLFLHLVLGAWAVRLLAYHLCENKAASFLAGAAYAFSPYVLSYPLSSGVTETANIEWLPLHILFLLRTVEERSPRNPVLAAVFLFLTAFSCWYYGAIALIFTTLYLLFLVVRAVPGHLRARRGAATPPPLVSPEGARRSAATPPPLVSPEGARRVARLAAMFLIFFLLIIIPALAFKTTLDSPDALLPSYVTQRTDENLAGHLGVSFHNFTSLVDLLKPGKGNLNVTATNDLLVRSSYAGFIVVFLALAGLPGKDERKTWWLFGAAIFLLLAMGPYLMVSATIHLASPTSPFYLLFMALFPFFSKMAIPFRFILVVTLSLAVLAAFGLRAVSCRHLPARQALFALILSVQVILEFFLLSPAPYPVLSADGRVPSFYYALRDDRERYAILDLPAMRGATKLNVTEYFYYQTVHGKAIPYHISGSYDRTLRENHFTRALVDLEKGVYPSPDDARRMKLGLRTLARHREIRYILLHEHLLEPEKRAQTRKMLVKYLGEPATFRDGASTILRFTVYGSRKSR